MIPYAVYQPSFSQIRSHLFSLARLNSTFQVGWLNEMVEPVVLILIRTPLGPAILSLVEVVLLFSRVLYTQDTLGLSFCWEICPLLECPLSEVSLLAIFPISQTTSLNEMLLIYDFYYEHSKLSINIV